MSEELRFFLRVALYTGGIALVYWFVSYEWAGTVLLVFLAAAVAAAVVILAVTVRATRSEVKPPDGSPARRAGELVNRILGFEEHAGEASSAPLEISDDVFPTSTIWPLVLAVGIVLVGLGLLYGPWLWIPGAGLTLAAGVAWLTELKDPGFY